MEITRKEYNKALDVIEAYHKQLFINNIPNAKNVHKTPLIEWDKLSELDTRTRSTLESNYQYYLNNYNKMLYVEDLDWKTARRFRGFGKYSWKNFENVRGY